jgi:hypothetical protein
VITRPEMGRSSYLDPAAIRFCFPGWRFSFALPPRPRARDETLAKAQLRSCHLLRPRPRAVFFCGCIGSQFTISHASPTSPRDAFFRVFPTRPRPKTSSASRCIPPCIPDPEKVCILTLFRWSPSLAGIQKSLCLQRFEAPCNVTQPDYESPALTAELQALYGFATI